MEEYQILVWWCSKENHYKKISTRTYGFQLELKWKRSVGLSHDDNFSAVFINYTLRWMVQLVVAGGKTRNLSESKKA